MKIRDEKNHYAALKTESGKVNYYWLNIARGAENHGIDGQELADFAEKFTETVTVQQLVNAYLYVQNPGLL